MALDMAKYNVTSNCISPFAWSRMIGTIPAETPDQRARVEKLKTMETAKIAPIAVYLASDASQAVTGQTIYVDSGANLEAFPRDFVYMGRE